MTRRGIALLAAALLVPSAAMRAAPLDKEGCAKLKVEQAELEHAGVRGNMGKGPQWAKANLEPDKLEQIRRLLEVDEQLIFRCHVKSLVTLPKDIDLDPAAQEPGATKAPKAQKAQKKGSPSKAAATPTDAAPQAKKEQKAAKKAPPDKADGEPAKKEQKAAGAAKKAKAKAKADDAYRPPGQEQ